MRRILLSFVACALLAPYSHARRQPGQATVQTAAQPQRDPQAVAIVQQVVKAMGAAAQSPPTSIVASGTYTRYLAGSTVSYPLRVEVLGSDQFRWEIDTPDLGTIVTVVSGTAAWSQSTQGTEPIAVAEIPGKTCESFPFLALAAWANSPTVGLAMVGPETLAGRSVDHITVTPTLAGNTDPNRENRYETTQRRELFLDRQTLLPYRMRYYSHPLDWRVPLAMEVEYGNFQTVNGLSFPASITTFRGALMLSQIQLNSLTLNVPVSAVDFQPR